MADGAVLATASLGSSLPIVLHACYAKSGTDIGYAATSFTPPPTGAAATQVLFHYAIYSTDIPHGGSMSLGASQYGHTILGDVRYAY
eukprot:1084305-Rhodomonas_salina.3